MNDSLCTKCGAPPKPGLVACGYCDTPYPGAGTGIVCPGCTERNVESAASCAQCGASLLRTCVFCAAGSSLAAPSCTRCGEAFEGAEQRKKAREEHERQQKLLGLATAGITALGAAASTPMGQSLLGQLFDGIKDELKKG